MWLLASLPFSFAEYLVVLTVAGLSNREQGQLWLNSSSTAPGTSSPVMWPYPEADQTWLPYVERLRNETFTPIQNASICGLVAQFRSNIAGLVIYNDTADANKYLAVTAGGLVDALPVSAALLESHTCLKSLPIVATVPAFTDSIQAYKWAASQLLPNTSQSVMVGACRSNPNYTCGWSDPLAAATIDYGVMHRAFVHNLAPANDPVQTALYQQYASHLKPLGVFLGWAEPEPAMVSHISAAGGVVICGAPNLSFLGTLSGHPGRLPATQSTSCFDRNRSYVVFQSNEGDTAKNAYSFRGGSWLQSRNLTVPISWGASPLIAEMFPSLWRYYVDNSRPLYDQYFAATGGYGYSPSRRCTSSRRYTFSRRHVCLIPTCLKTMCGSTCGWASGLNFTAYNSYIEASNGTIKGFSQQAINDTAFNFESLINHTLLDLASGKLFYPYDCGGCKINSNASAFWDCLETSIRKVAAQHEPPFVILVYGENVPLVDGKQLYLADTANEMQRRLSGDMRVVGVEDAIALQSGV